MYFARRCINYNKAVNLIRLVVVPPPKSGGAAGICSWSHPSTSACNRFFAATLPFFFLRDSRFLSLLAGDTLKVDSKNSELPILRKNITSRKHDCKQEKHEPKNHSLPTMRQPKDVEKWSLLPAFRRRDWQTALLMPRLRIPVFQVVNPILFLFSVKAAWRFFN